MIPFLALMTFVIMFAIIEAFVPADRSRPSPKKKPLKAYAPARAQHVYYGGKL